MTNHFCMICGGEEGKAGRCRTCYFKNDPDHYLYFDEENTTPDTWDEGGIPTKKPDQEKVDREFL